MTKEHLESVRLEAIRQLEQEQQTRDAKRAKLQQEQANLEAADRSAAGTMLRAQKAFTEASKCPLCWIWQGELATLSALPSDNDDWDRFRCARGHEFEFPAP